VSRASQLALPLALGLGLELALAPGLAPAARAQSIVEIPTRTIARVIASGGTGRRFGHPVCRYGETLESSADALYTYALHREARSPDRPMVLDTGGLLAPHGIIHYAASTDPDALVELVAGLGYRALAFGVEELGAPREILIPVIRGLRRHRIPSIASNLHCVEEAVPLCEVLVDASDGPSIHAVGAQRMAVLAFLPDNATHRVAPELASGIVIEPIATALPRAVRRARGRGASVVVAVVGVTAAHALEMAQALPPDGRPDLVVLAGTGDLLFARPASVVPPVVQPPEDDAVEILVREGLLRAGYEMVAQPLGGRGIDAAPQVRDFLERIGDRLCEEWGRTLGGGRLSRPIDARGLGELVAGILLETADADVAIVSLGVLDARWRPSREDALTTSDIYIALEDDEPLVAAEVPSRWLTEVARSAGERGLLLAGLAWEGRAAQVRGRALQSRAKYRVVTVRFLARGGNQALPALPNGVAWEPVASATLRSIVLEYLRTRTDLDPRDALPDPRTAPEWILRGDLDGTFSGSSIGNPARYDSSLLNRGSTIALGIEISLRAEANAPDWSWENHGVVRYRAQWAPSSTPGTAGAFQEAVDQIQTRSLGAWRGLRPRPSDWFVPDLYVEVFLESEISQPAARAWHWMLVRPTIGARFRLATELEVKLSTGFQGQLLEPGGEAELGVGAVITLRPWDLFRIEDRYATIEALVDWFMVDLGDQNRWQLRSTFDARFDLAGPLALTLGIRLYAQQERGQQVGIALDATAGFRIGWLGRAVGP
jgi:hypothetical protein